MTTTSKPVSERDVARSFEGGPRVAAKVRWPAAPLALVTALAFIPVVGNGFVRWDDDRNFLDNPWFRGLTVESARWAWSTSLLGVYQPLSWLMMEAEFDAWGLDPRGYHVVSLIGHVVNAAALWVLTRALLERVSRVEGVPAAPDRLARASALAVALYAVHPLRAEVVAWASCQPYLPSGFLALAAALAYLHACDDDRPASGLGWLAAAWLLYALALMTKVVPVMLPAVLLVLDVYPLRRIGPGRWLGRGAWRVYGEKVPFVAIALPLMVVAVRVRGVDDFRAMSAEEFDPVVRLARACFAPWFYLYKTVFPLDLVAFYPPPTGRRGYLSVPYEAAVIATASATIAAIAVRCRRPGLTASWVCYLLMLAPNSGLVATGKSFVADRYSYFPSMAGAVALAYALARLAARPRARKSARAVATALVVFFSALSWRQCLDWRSSEALWTRTYAYAPDDPDVNMAVGVAKNQEGKAAEAKRHFLRVLELDQTNTLALVNLGGIAFQEHDFAGAEAAWNKALAIDRNEPEALSGLGLVREQQGRILEAERFQRKALERRPDYTQARNNLAVVLAKEGKTDEAATELTLVVGAAPGDAVAHYNLGRTLAKLDRHNEALFQFAEALRLRPGVANRHSAMGIVSPSAEPRGGSHPRVRGRPRHRPPERRSPPRNRRDQSGALTGIFVAASTNGRSPRGPFTTPV